MKVKIGQKILTLHDDEITSICKTHIVCTMPRQGSIQVLFSRAHFCGKKKCEKEKYFREIFFLLYKIYNYKWL